MIKRATLNLKTEKGKIMEIHITSFWGTDKDENDILKWEWTSPTVLSSEITFKDVVFIQSEVDRFIEMVMTNW